MNTFTYIFLAALVISYAVQLWLAQRQITHIRSHQNAVPSAFKETISLDVHKKAANYTIDKNFLSKISGALDVIVLLCLTLGGGIEIVSNILSTYDFSPVTSGTCLILSIFLILTVVELPLDIYQTFKVEEKYGFNRNTPKRYIADQILQLSLTLLLGAPLLVATLWIMAEIGQYWWLWAWLLLLTCSLLLTWAYPTFIAPLFNKFSLLDNPELTARIESLLSKCGFSSQGIFVMDGSRRSGHGNAYFTGFGSNKRIVFFDTLIDSLDHDEIEAVLAHELGHFKRKHVIKMLVASAVSSLIGFALLGWLATQNWFYSGLGVDQTSNAAALLLFFLVSPVFTLFMQPITAYVQRKHEFEADDFASLFAKPSALISALVKLYRDNASTLTPDPLYSAFHYSHPPATIRIANLVDKSKPINETN